MGTIVANNYILGFLLTLTLSSCIKEEIDKCPDFGKYPVSFFDEDTSFTKMNQNVLLYVLRNRDTLHIKSLEYIITAGERELRSEGKFRLYPDLYSFKAIKSQNKMQLDDNHVKLKNGEAYTYASFIGKVSKSPDNKFGIRFGLFNSLIRVVCTLDVSDNSLFEITKVEISSPDDTSILLDIESGKCNYAQEVTDYYDSCTLENEPSVFYYYCVPIVRSRYIVFKISIKEHVSEKRNTLYSRAFLKTDIEQGKIYDFHFNVTPWSVIYKTTTILDWTTFIYNQILRLN
ncbi:hypothetical protein SDC9_131214 [bioreactor metagenome]|uniref:Uncharacterized protein n=1 Tax=bioreactor metagenome TaxID=1076179 RepID=A0A645D5A1_9ZZZZ|nr:hypothetical protein [Rikenellaceae bacterium]